MISARRAAWNFALDRAVDHARALRKPLVVLEALEVDYPWASDRLHCFVLQGMHDNLQAFAGSPVTYFPYVEPSPGAGRGLLEALARSACLVITDEFPCFFLPRIVAAAATRLDVCLEVVDSNAAVALETFVVHRLARYGELHNEPGADITSRLSPYLHFGHLAAHQVFDRVMRHEGWSRRAVAGKRVSGAREGWWGTHPSTERFLDQLIVWRELGYNMCAKRPDDYDRYDSLPAWAQDTLRVHRRDRRPHVYDLSTLERGATHDPLWNAAQGQLLQEGWFHNYMRMLWGKKILEWSKTPQDALERMITIMNRWSLDGRNPNSYSGYFWTLGRYDRPWPERPIFGTVRSMSSSNTARKIDVRKYIARFGPSITGEQRDLPLT